MAISTSCPQCQALFQLPDEMAGEQVRCEKCKQVFAVPSGVPTPPAIEAPASEELAPATVVESNAVPARPSKPAPPQERLASTLVSVAMLLLFLGGLSGVGAFAMVWIATHLGPPVRVSAAPPLHPPVPFQPMPNPNPNPPVVPKIGKIGIKMPPKDLPIPPKQPIGPLTMQVILVAFNADGAFEDRRAMAVTDPNLPFKGPTKVYLLTLEQGRTYRIWVSFGEDVTALTLFDPNGNEAKAIVGREGTTMVHTAQQAGVHRLQVSAPLPNAGQRDYTLRITTDP